MVGTLLSAALLVIASLVVGQSVLVACGHRTWTWLSGPVGLAALLTVSAIVAGFHGQGTAIAIVLALLLIFAGLAFGIVVKAPPARASRFTTHAPAALAALLAALFAAIPFIAAGNVGILGVGLVNDDMASHLLLADWIDERFRPEPVLVDQGYPLGPHALVAGLAALLGASSIDVFAGLTLAIPALTALVAFGALEGVRTPARVGAAALVALPYMAAAYLAQEAFKEPIVALFLLAFALLLPALRGWRDAIPLGVLAAGAVYVYSFPGLAWLGGVAVAWGAAALIERRRSGVGDRRLRSMDARTVRSMDAERLRGVDPRAAVLATAVGAATLVVLILPELSRLLDFADFRALHPDRANEGGLGNLPGQISPLEALGIWPTSEFRLSAAASSLPAVVFYAGGLLAASALALALPHWLRRYGTAIPAALLAAAVLYLAARAFGTVYTSAKALAIAAPLIALIVLGGLSSSGRRGLTALAAAFAVAAAFSSFLILRQAPVAPEAHAGELAEIRPLVAGEKLLFLGRDNFILHELRGSKPFTHVRNFYDPYFVEPNFELEDVGSKFDFDSVTAVALERFPYVLTTRAAYASGPPPGHEPVVETDSYALWERTAPVGKRRPGETGPEPGRTRGCDGSPKRIATFAREPVLAGAPEWSATTIENGESADVELDLPAGAWELSLQYDASRPLTLSGVGGGTELPANLDYRGTAPLWAAGTIRVPKNGRVELTATVDDPPLAGRMLGADSVAHLGALAATPAGGSRPGGDCGDYVDWYLR